MESGILLVLLLSDDRRVDPCISSRPPLCLCLPLMEASYDYILILLTYADLFHEAVPIGHFLCYE